MRGIVYRLRVCPECNWPEHGQQWPSRHEHDPEVGACYACDNPCSRCDASTDPIRLHDCGRFHRPSEACPNGLDIAPLEPEQSGRRSDDD